MNGRSSTRARAGAVLLVLATLALSACDTGDGKTLQPYDPDDYPSQAADTTSVTDDTTSDIDAVPPIPTSPIANGDGSNPTGSFQVFAPWLDGGDIDPLYTCDGDDIAPALSWGAIPAGTVEIAVSLVDDSAVSDGSPFVHWVIAGLDPDEIALVEGDVPEHAVQALNYFGDVGYGGPCPPPGDEPHLYRLTAYALNSPLQVADGDTADNFLDAIARASIGSTDLTGLYQR